MSQIVKWVLICRVVKRVVIKQAIKEQGHDLRWFFLLNNDPLNKQTRVYALNKFLATGVGNHFSCAQGAWRFYELGGPTSHVLEELDKFGTGAGDHSSCCEAAGQSFPKRSRRRQSCRRQNNSPRAFKPHHQRLQGHHIPKGYFLIAAQTTLMEWLKPCPYRIGNPNFFEAV